MDVEDRLRDGLRRTATSAAPHTEAALERTLVRARRGDRIRGTAVVLIGLVILAAAVALVRYPGSPVGPATPDPVALLGSWSTQVAPSDGIVDRARLAGTWTLTFVADGALLGTPPGAYGGTLGGDTYQASAGSEGSVLRTDLLHADTCAGADRGTYVVREDDGELALQVVSDACSARIALLTSGRWTPARPGASCVNQGGGACLGDMTAGTYRTRQFQPAVRYTVPAGWSNTQDLPGNLLLQPGGGDERFIGVYRNVTVPDGCAERGDPAVGTSVDRIAAWLTSHPGVRATTPVPVSVGGLSGLRLDVSLASDWRRTCPFSAGRPIVPILYGIGPSALHHTLLPGFTERLYLLRLESAREGAGNVVIEVGPEGRSLSELLAASGPLLPTMVFDPRG